MGGHTWAKAVGVKAKAERLAAAKLSWDVVSLMIWINEDDYDKNMNYYEII